jgi:uncharacterized membrane protein YqjE
MADVSDHVSQPFQGRTRMFPADLYQIKKLRTTRLFGLAVLLGLITLVALYLALVSSDDVWLAPAFLTCVLGFYTGFCIWELGKRVVKADDEPRQHTMNPLAKLVQLIVCSFQGAL